MKNWKETLTLAFAIVCFIATGTIIGVYAGDIAAWIDMIGTFWPVMGLVAAIAAVGVLAKLLGVEASEE